MCFIGREVWRKIDVQKVQFKTSTLLSIEQLVDYLEKNTKLLLLNNLKEPALDYS